MINSTRKAILESLAEMSDLYPDWRFGQMAVNIASWSGEGEPPSAYDVEDEDFLRALQSHLAQRRDKLLQHVTP